MKDCKYSVLLKFNLSFRLFSSSDPSLLQDDRIMKSKLITAKYLIIDFIMTLCLIEIKFK
ncbi:MAG: hypothetical protein EDM72_01245 [Chlorobiota bacterium]|nr:MAG: hypothetical protein EDM72_01245 [Chlorobiota bacterium]